MYEDDGNILTIMKRLTDRWYGRMAPGRWTQAADGQKI